MRTCFIYSTNWTQGLHLGAARVALLNLELARQTDGECVLHCETYRSNSNVCVNSSVLENLTWISDNAPYRGPYFGAHYQNQYKQAVQRLLSMGWAYWDYATSQEMNDERKASGDNFQYSRKFAAFDEDRRKTMSRYGRPCVIRLKMNRTTARRLHIDNRVLPDVMKGNIVFDLADMHDFAIVDSSGRYTSYLTSAINYKIHNIDFAFVDQQHLKSIPAQMFISSKLGFALPKFGHVGSFYAPGGVRKLSSRRIRSIDDQDWKQLLDKAFITYHKLSKAIQRPADPCYIEFYKNIGFNATAIRQYLLSTIYEKGNICSFDNIRHKNVTFNVAELLRIQNQLWNQCDLDEKCWLANKFLSDVGLSNIWPIAENNIVPPRLKYLIRQLGSRMTIGSDILSLTDYFDNNLNYIDNETNEMHFEDAAFIYEGCPNF